MKTLVGNQKCFGFILVTLLILSLGTPGTSYGVNVGEPRTVRLFYLLPNDRPYRADVVATMKTGILEVQSFYAEQMAAHGHGNKTFQIETDAQGNPIVHRVDGKYPDSGYSRGYTEGEIEEAFDNSKNVILIVMDISRGTYSGVAGSGTGGKSSGWVLFYREWDWFTAAHELGHAFGLHHDFRDDAYILSYGRRNRSSASLSICAAEFLAVHPYFNPDIPLENESPPTVKLISPTVYPVGAESVPIRLRVRDDGGLHQVLLFVNTKRALGVSGPEVKACQGLVGETDAVVEFNYDGKTPSDRVFSGSPIYTSFSDPLQHTIYVVAVDSDGNRTDTFSPISFTLEEGVVQEIIPLSERTSEVRDAIVAAIPDASSSSDVTASDLAEITSLSMLRKNITSLKADDFDGLSALTHLDLRSNSLTTLPKGIFDGLSSLRYLGLSSNALTTLPEGIFDGLSSLSNLQLGNNSLTTLPNGIFDGLSSLITLDLRSNSLTTLPNGIFDGLNRLDTINLSYNSLTTLPNGIFDGLSSLRYLYLRYNSLTTLPEGIFDGHTALRELSLGHAGFSLPITVSLEKVGGDQFKAVAPTGAPFDIVLPLSVVNGSINSGATTITIPAGSVESEPLTVTQTPGRSAVVNVDIGTLPGLPANHSGYVLVKSTDLPLALTAGITPVSDRTPQVREAILGVVRLNDPSVSSYAEITATHLTGVTALYLNDKNITSLKVGDFDGLTDLEELRLYSNQLTTLPEGLFEGLTALETLTLYGNQFTTLPEGIFNNLTALTTLRFGLNQLTTLPSGLFEGLTALTDLRMIGNQLTMLPDGIFEGLTSLTTLRLQNNAVNPLPLTVSLEKVANGQFKAVAPSGAPFDIVLPLTVANGSITGGATTLTIPAGSVESEVLTVTRTSGATFATSVNIGTLPGLPANHSGYTLIKSADLPITVTEGDIPGTSVLTLTVGENPNDPFNSYPFGRIGYNQHPEPSWNLGTLSSPAFVIDGISYTVTSLYYMTHSKSLTLRTSPDLPRGFVLYLGSQQFNSVDSEFTYRHSGDGWENVNLNWSVGQTVQVRIVETTPMLLGPPTSLQATTQNENVMLTWELPANSDPTTLPVNEYEVRISTDGGTTWEYGWGEFSDSGPGEENRNGVTIGSNRTDVYYILSYGTEYTFEVRALGGDGSGDAASVTLVLDIITPLSRRTPQVRDAIVAAVPDVNSANNVTKEHLAAITSLSIRGRDITELRVEDFLDLPALKTLGISGTKLTSLPRFIFDNLPSLTELYLGGNNDLNELPWRIFDNLTALKKLYLNENGMPSLRSGVFDNLTVLEELGLGGNDLRSLPSGIFDNLTVLKKLNMSYNELVSLRSGVFDNNTALTELHLYYNDLNSLPSGIFDNNTALTTLTIWRNNLSSLSAGIFDNNTALTNLSIGFNNFSSLPSGIFEKLTNLIGLGLLGNQFRSLPDGIFKGLSSLTSINVSQNPVEPLPLTVSLEKVADDQFKAVAPAGALFDIVLPLTVTNGSISGGATTLTIPAGNVESETLTVTRTPGTSDDITVDIGTLPGLPTNHSGYTLVKSDDLPLIFNAVSTPSETTLMAIKGTITEDGTPAEAGLEVTVTIGRTTQTEVSEAGGVYSAIFTTFGAVVATSGDTVTVQVLNPNTGEDTERTISLSSEQIIAKKATIDLQFSPSGREYLLSVPEGISLIHVPLKVTAVDGATKTLESVGDLYDALGGAVTVSLLITHDPQAQRWVGYFGSGDRGSSADKVLTDDLGIIAVLTAPASVSLSGDALGTNGRSSITVHPGINLVGVPLKDSRITRVTDLFALEGIKDNVSLTLVSDNGEIKLVEQAGDSGDIPVTGGQSFILVAKSVATVEISGTGWSNVPDPAVAPSTALTGIEVRDTTPVLAVSGSILPPVGGASLPRLGVPDFSVTVKNLSTGTVDTAMTDDDGASYQFTFVDIETGRAAQVGDILEITAQSPDSFVGVQPLRYVVTVEDVKRSRIPLAELVAYEIPATTELLLNYPNPFNPETWIPYRLAEGAFVTLTVYDSNGRVVRQLEVGHRIAAVYESRSEAIYWDGRTEFGERVASGIYFYTLTAGDYSATRKMVILK